ncbi:MAG: nucleotidyltransferase [Deltaproteobacteria bacterium]|nr:nucleotidyltransferase [Deltaproteobacteria bacterium]
MASTMYLLQILQKYRARDLTNYSAAISQLKSTLQTWASSCYIEIINSGSRAKGTAISLASDVDYLVSLASSCNENSGGLKSIYDSLYSKLSSNYQNVRKQNVSVRINLNGLEVDVTPARKQSGNTNNHNLYVSKFDTWKQTNIQKHITDISQSGRTNEIKLLKIWRELNKLDFPSIYLEYLVINNILLNKSKEVANLENNVWHAINELAKDNGNPLSARIIDPANSSNILSDLLNQTEKNKIISAAKTASRRSNWNQIVW